MTEKCDLCGKKLEPYEKRIKVVYLRQETYIEDGEELLVMHLICFFNYIKGLPAEIMAKVLERGFG